MPDGFRAFLLFGKADMAKATAKVPTTGKEDLSGWEKKVELPRRIIKLHQLNVSRDA